MTRRSKPACGIRQWQYSVSSAHQKSSALGRPTASTISRAIMNPHQEPHRPTAPSGWMDTGTTKVRPGSSSRAISNVARHRVSGTMSSSITQASLKSLERKSRRAMAHPPAGPRLTSDRMTLVGTPVDGSAPIWIGGSLALSTTTIPCGGVVCAATALRQRASDWGALWLRTRATTWRPRPSFLAPLSWIVSGLCKLVKAPMLSGRRLSVHPVTSDGGALNDCGSSWTLAARRMTFQPAVWATTGARTNV